MYAKTSHVVILVNLISSIYYKHDMLMLRNVLLIYLSGLVWVAWARSQQHIIVYNDAT